jgi:hypothetical protein
MKGTRFVTESERCSSSRESLLILTPRGLFKLKAFDFPA